MLIWVLCDDLLARIDYLVIWFLIEVKTKLFGTSIFFFPIYLIIYMNDIFY